MTTSQSLQIVEIPNAFNPHSTNRSTLDWTPGKSLADYFPSLLQKHEIVLSLNGRVIPEEERASTYPLAGDNIVFCPVIAGGGGGKNILRVVALIALTVASGGIAAAALGAMGGTIGGLSAAASLAIVKAGVIVVGGLLINALIPPPKPHRPEQGDTSSSYGIDGAKNTSAEGTMVPIVYGKFRTGGNIINNYVINDGKTQWLYMLLNQGEGPVEDLTDIEVNDEAITAYKDYETQLRMGSPDQDPIGWFENTIVPQNINFKLTTDWHYATTSAEVDSLRLDFYCPALYKLNSKGDSKEHFVEFEVQYRKVGTTAWTQFPSANAVTTYAETIEYFQQPTGYDANGQPTGYAPYVVTGDEYRNGNDIMLQIDNAPDKKVGAVRQTAELSSTFEIRDNARNIVRRSFFSSGLEEAEYELRARRKSPEVQGSDDKTADQIYWSDLNEITTEKVAYRNTALLALKVRLSDQLNGLPKVTCINHGKQVRWYNEATKQWEFSASANPAWVALDILTNKRYGGGAALSRFDMAKWREWAKYCDTKGLEFNGVFDTQTNVWDACQVVFRCGHAQVVRHGTRYSVALEAPADPVMLFSVANMKPGSFKESWLPMAERANTIEGTYYDKEDGYKQRNIRVYDKAAIEANLPERSTNVDLRGVTDAQQAWDDLHLMLNFNRYIQRTVEFTASIEAIACTVGDVVLVQHDMPQWGFAGKTEASSTTSLVKLDREVTMEYGKTYSVMVHHGALRRYTGTVSSVIVNTFGAMLVLNGFDGAQKVDRIKIAGKDLRVEQVYSGSPWSVEVEDYSGITPGMTYELWATDVLESRNVVNMATVSTPMVTTEVTTTAALTAAPDQFVNWLFGEVNKTNKPFRIKAISGSHDYERDIVALEYNATVYDPAGAVPTPNYSSLSTAVQHATISGVYESHQSDGIATITRVTVTFSSTQQTYGGSNVYLSRNGAGFQWVGKDLHAVSIDAAIGDQLVFKVVATNALGKSAPESTAPTIPYVVAGSDTPADQVEGFTYAVTDAGIRFRFAAPLNDNWVTSQIKIGPSFEFGELIFNAKATEFVWGFQTAGVYKANVRHFLPNGVSSATDASIQFEILNPAQVTLQPVQVDRGNAQVSFSSAKTTQPLRHYIVKLGTTTATYEEAPELAKVPGSATTANLIVTTNGAKRVWIVGEDMAGNRGTPSYIDFVVTTEDLNTDTTPPPSLSGFEVFMQNIETVTLRWALPTYTVGGGPGTVDIYGADWEEGASRPAFSSARLIKRVIYPENYLTDTIGVSKRRIYWAKNVTNAGVAQITVTPDANGLVGQTSKIGNTDLGDLIIEARNLADGSITPNKLGFEIGGGNLLTNSGFERSAADGAPWFASGVYSGFISTTRSRNGLRSHKMISSAANSFAYQAIPCRPNTTYTASGWVYVESITGPSFSGRSLLLVDNTDAFSADTSFVAGHPTGQWVRKVVTLKTSATATSLIVRTYGLEGTVYWDDLQLEEGEIATAYAPKVDEINPGSITQTELADNSITTPKLAAGAVTAGTIAAGAIQAQHLLIAPKSLIVDPTFAQGLAGWTNWRARFARSAPEVPAGCPVEYAAVFNGRDSFMTTRIPVITGEQYRVTGWVYRHPSLTSTGYVAFGHDVTGAIVQTVVLESGAASGWYRIDGSLVIAANVVSLGVAPWNAQAHGGTIESWFADLQVEKKNDASLIVDGSISATKIAANAIAVGTLAVQNGALVNAMIANGTIDNAKIANLDAAKINTGFLSADRIQAGSIVASKINTNGLSIRDANSNIILDANTPLSFGRVTVPNGSITNAMIGQTIQSDGYVAGVTGWAINKNGAAEFNNIIARGTITASSVTADSIYANALQNGATGNSSAVAASNGVNVGFSEVLLLTSSVAVSSLTRGVYITGVVNFTWTIIPADTVTLRLKRNGVTIMTLAASKTESQGSIASNIPIFTVDSPGAGTHQYTVTLTSTGASGSVIAAQRALGLISFNK